jgi:hypothetical protein
MITDVRTWNLARLNVFHYYGTVAKLGSKRFSVRDLWNMRGGEGTRKNEMKWWIGKNLVGIGGGLIFKVLALHSPGVTEENHENAQSE